MNRTEVGKTIKAHYYVTGGSMTDDINLWCYEETKDGKTEYYLVLHITWKPDLKYHYLNSKRVLKYDDKVKANDDFVQIMKTWKAVGMDIKNVL